MKKVCFYQTLARRALKDVLQEKQKIQKVTLRARRSDKQKEKVSMVISKLIFFIKIM